MNGSDELPDDYFWDSEEADQEPDRYQPAQGQSRLGKNIQTGDYVEAVLAFLEYIEALQDAIGKGGIASFDTGDYSYYYSGVYHPASALVYLAEILDNALRKKTRDRVGAKLIRLSRLENFVREIDDFLGVSNLTAFTDIDELSLPVLLYERPGGLLEPLTDKEWQALSDKAVADMLKRRQLADRSGLNETDTNFTIHPDYSGFCAYLGSKKRYRFANNEAKHAAEAIVAAEKVRLNLFLEALQGTLRFLDRLTSLPDYSERHIQRNDIRNDKHQLAREIASGIISTFQDFLNEDTNKQKRLWGDLDELVGRAEAYEEDSEEDDDKDSDEWDEEDEDEEEYDEEEDYINTPPDFVTTTSTPAYAPAFQEPERHQPAQGQSRLGRDIQTGNFVEVTQTARRQGLYILGLQGYGKSGLLENLIIQDIKQHIGMCVLDPKGELIDNVIARLPNSKKEEKVILLDLKSKDYYAGLNLFDCADPTDDSAIMDTLSQVLHVFEKAFGITQLNPLMYDLLFKIGYVLIANPGYTMVDIPFFLTNEACRKALVQNVTHSDAASIRSFWERWDNPKLKSPIRQLEESQTILNKFNDFEHHPLRHIVGQSTSSIDLRTIMDSGKILLVKLDKRREAATSLIGSIIVAQILNASETRQTKKQFNLYADEFARFATEDFATLIEEARYAGIGVAMAHQNRGQLELSEKQADANLKQRTLSVGNLVVFRAPTDADSLAGQFTQEPEAAWIEVQKPQDHRRIEDEVVDEVEEDIMEISQNPVDFLLGARGSHGSERVSFITQEYLASLAGNPTDQEKALLNKLLVSVEEGRVEIGTDAFIQLVTQIMDVHFDQFTRGYRSGYSGIQWRSQAAGFIRALILGKLPNITREIKKIRKEIAYIQVKKEIENSRREKQRDAVTDEEIRLRGWDKVMEEWYEKNAWRYINVTGPGEWVEWQAFQFVDRLSLLLELCAELAKEEGKIKVPTGHKRMVKRIRKQPVWLTDESERITHQQPSEQEMTNRMARELINLPLYTARVKITTAAGTEEYAIRTLEPEKGIRGDAHLRKRTEVEAEIRQRREQYGEPPEEEPPTETPILRHPQR